MSMFLACLISLWIGALIGVAMMCIFIISGDQCD